MGGRILVVEDDWAVARSHARALAKHGETVIASSARSALEALEDVQRISALIVDVHLPDGSGLDVAAEARKRSSLLPILVLTGDNSPQNVNSAFRLNSAMLCKPADPADLDQFVSSIFSGAEAPAGTAKERLMRFAKNWKLTRQETRIVELALHGTPRGEMSGTLGISENTLKWHIKSIIRKSGHGIRNISDIVRLIAGHELRSPTRESRKEPR